jgi:hypothetical protein
MATHISTVLIGLNNAYSPKNKHVPLEQQQQQQQQQQQSAQYCIIKYIVHFDDC